MKNATILWAALVVAGAGGAWACSTDDGNGQTYDVSFDSDVTEDPATDACTSTDPFCSADLRQVMQCDPATGGMTVLETCAEGTVCVAGSCQAAACEPNTAICLNESTSQVCREDGSGWDVVPCPDYQKCDDDSGFCDFPCMLRVFVLIDQSGSMGGDTHPTKWEQARTAMAELVAAESAASVEFGLGVFPSGGESCGTSAQVVYPVPVDPVDLIDQYFTSHSPSGNTPLLAALEFHLVDTSANLNDPAYYNYLLVISDGADTCYDDHCEIECGLPDRVRGEGRAGGRRWTGRDGRSPAPEPADPHLRDRLRRGREPRGARRHCRQRRNRARPMARGLGRDRAERGL
jgi:hypothetical protein